MQPRGKKYIQNCTGADCAPAKAVQSNRKISRVTFYVLAALFAGVSLYILFYSPQMQINVITVTGTQQLSSQEIQQKVSESLQGRYLKFIPKNNFLFIFPSEIENLIKNDYKKVRSVSVQKKFPDSMSIDIDERKSLLVWCKDDSDCFLLDENGIAYSAADFNSPDLVQNNLLKVTDTGGADVAIGDKVIDPQYEQYLLAVGGGLGSLGIVIDGDQIITPSRMAQEIQVKTTQGYDIYFSTQFSLDSAIKTLAVVLKKQIPPDQLVNLAYIDLRSENKAFYKMNNADASVGSPDATSANSQAAAPVDDGTKKTVDNKKK